MSEPYPSFAEFFDAEYAAAQAAVATGKLRENEADVQRRRELELAEQLTDRLAVDGLVVVRAAARLPQDAILHPRRPRRATLTLGWWLSLEGRTSSRDGSDYSYDTFLGAIICAQTARSGP